MNNTIEHQKLVDDILFAVGSGDLARVWRNATGTARSMDAQRIISFGLKGSSDIIGLLRDGRILCIEVKTGNAKQTEQQKNFQKMIERFNGVYILARSIEDALRRVKTELGTAAQL